MKSIILKPCIDSVLAIADEIVSGRFQLSVQTGTYQKAVGSFNVRVHSTENINIQDISTKEL